MEFGMFSKKRIKHKREELKKEVDELTGKKFSAPLTIYISQVKSVEMNGNKPKMVNIELNAKNITCLKDAVELNKMVVRSVERRLRPQVGDIIPILDDDPTDIFLQVLFELVGRGKI